MYYFDHIIKIYTFFNEPYITYVWNLNLLSDDVFNRNAMEGGIAVTSGTVVKHLYSPEGIVVGTASVLCTLLVPMPKDSLVIM